MFLMRINSLRRFLHYRSARYDVIRHQHASVPAENNQSFMHDLHMGVAPGVTETLAYALSLQIQYIYFNSSDNVHIQLDRNFTISSYCPAHGE